MDPRSLRFAGAAGAVLVGLTLIASVAQSGEKGAKDAEDAEDAKARHSEVLVSIAAPEHNGKRTLSFSKGFPVVITNLSECSLGVWREWCSWGYYTVSFEARASDGRKVQFRKKGRAWTRNFPDRWMLAPEESLVRNVVLASDEWSGFEELRIKEGTPLFLRVVLEVPADEESKEKSVWSGKVVSPEWLYHVEP